MNEDSLPSDEEIKSQIYSECRSLEFIAKKWADARISGAYKSIQKGSGIEFEETRLYTPGDDARRIDWKVSARKQQPYIKSFREERDQTVHILTDVSPSSLLGVSQPKIKKIGEICAFLTSIATFNNDAVGGVTFYDDIIEYIPARKGMTSSMRLLHSIYKTAYSLKNHTFLNKRASLQKTLLSTSGILKRKSLVFIISDFNVPLDFGSALQMLSKRHDVYAVRLNDSLERTIPTSGIFSLLNPETGKTFKIDFASSASRLAFLRHIESHESELREMCSRAKVPFLSCNSDEDIRSKLFSFFQERSRINAR